MNKKGFTLIELLVTIVIMALILIMVVPSITALQNNNKDKPYEYYADSLIEAAKIFVDKEGEDINSIGAKNFIGCVDITYQDLLDSDLIKPFSDENIESEKGIITQEIHMCDDRPIDVLYEHIRKNTLHNNSFKDSIIGTVNDINSIDKKVLDTCYNTFYHPSNMFLVVTGNFNVDEMINAIKENQSAKEFKKENEIKIKEHKEPNEVVLKEEIIKMNTNIPKLAYNIKIPYCKFKIEKRRLNLYLYIIFSILFDDSSVFNEKAKKGNIITNAVYTNILNCDSHILISLINETFKYNELLDMIKSELKQINISEEDLERKKKVLISNEIFSFENIEIINEMIIDSIIFDNTIETNIVDIINSLNINELNEIIKNIDFSNVSTIILKKNK